MELSEAISLCEKNGYKAKDIKTDSVLVVGKFEVSIMHIVVSLFLFTMFFPAGVIYILYVTDRDKDRVIIRASPDGDITAEPEDVGEARNEKEKVRRCRAVGKVYFCLGYYEKAFESFERGISITDDEESHYCLGQCYEKLGHLEQALSKYQAVARGFIDYYPFGLTEIEGRIKEVQKAKDKNIQFKSGIGALVKWNRIIGGIVIWCISLWWMFLRSKFFSILWLGLIIFFIMGIILGLLKEVFIALPIVIIFLLICIYPLRAIELRVQLWVLFALGQYEDAKNVCGKLVRRKPGKSEYHYNLAVIYEILEENYKAIKEYQQYLMLAPNADDADAVGNSISALESKMQQV